MFIVHDDQQYLQDRHYYKPNRPESIFDMWTQANYLTSVILIISVSSFSTLYVGTLYDLRLFQFQNSTDNPFPAQDPHLIISYLRPHQTQHDDFFRKFQVMTQYCYVM